MLEIHNQKILKFLLSNKKEQYSIRSISKEIGVDYKTVYILVNKLIDDGKISSKKIGQTILCSVNPRTFDPDVFRAEEIRRQELLDDKGIWVLYNNIKEIKKPFFILLVFGSYASGKTRKGSDIDMMLITDDDTINRHVKQVVSRIPLPVHLVDFTTEEFLSMLKTTEFNVGREAFYNNIIFFGIEDYYRLIAND